MDALGGDFVTACQVLNPLVHGDKQGNEGSARQPQSEGRILPILAQQNGRAEQDPRRQTTKNKYRQVDDLRGMAFPNSFFFSRRWLRLRIHVMTFAHAQNQSSAFFSAFFWRSVTQGSSGHESRAEKRK